ncbi:hypothetical protein PV371_37060 [Streptomyces sp. TX20-6-3]|uniref:hypothetical protein n=1 Tax=Streptomyces sp. TX20-6-3 TaxID=3028705 RepID=UPI0029B04B40|nr:hypothetical protein [Streptomyces sp. TX20-6-3]MDX2565222.1 hypothetical protein [Streptomyces sp. TX20-6-3]
MARRVGDGVALFCGEVSLGGGDVALETVSGFEDLWRPDEMPGVAEAADDVVSREAAEGKTSSLSSDSMAEPTKPPARPTPSVAKTPFWTALFRRFLRWFRLKWCGMDSTF